MTTFYFVRHGITEINAEGRFNGGGVDSPLIPAGVEATRRMASHLKNLSFDLAVSSPQMRAQTTAKLILAENPQAPKLTIIEELRELRLGDWDGKKIEDIRAAYPDDLQKYRTRPDLFEADKFHMESYTSLIQRSKKVIEKIAKENPDAQVLVVSHGILLVALLNTLKGVPLAKIRDAGILENSSLTVLDYSDGAADFKQWGQTY